MSTDKMREEFEEWYRRGVMRGADPDLAAPRFAKDRDGMYWDMWTRRSWQAWQASRTALVVNMPTPDPAIRYMDDPGKAGRILSQCRQAIEAAGITVKE